MYQYVRAFLRKRGKNQTWQSVDISGMLVINMLHDYIDGYVTLTNSAIGAGEFYIDIVQLKQFHTPYVGSLTFNDWIHTTGFPILPTLPEEPQFVVSNILYSDANQANYRLRGCRPDIIPVTPEFEFYIDNHVDVLPLEERTDLAMLKDGCDVHLLQRTALISINGFYHYAFPRGIELQVADGSKNLLRRQTPDIGITSFASIGELQQLRIMPEMVLTGNPLEPTTNYQYQYGMYIATGVDMTNKSVMLSLGGYLHVEDDTFDIVNKEQGVIKVNFNRLNMPQRIFETERVLDLSALHLTRSAVREGSVSVPELYSNAALLRYITMPQSFVIVVDTPSLYRSKTMIEHTSIPGVYDCPTEPLYPLKTRYGRLVNYWLRRAEGLFILETDVIPAYDYLHNTTTWRNERIVNNTVLPLPKLQMDCYLEGIHGVKKL